MIEANKYQKLEFLMQYPNDIPTSPGNYYWVYCPWNSFDVTFEELVCKLESFSNIELSFPEEFNSQRTRIAVNQITFKDYDKNTLLNIGTKVPILLSYLESSQDNRVYFINFLRSLCFLKPFYIGKADDLQKRLKQHFSGAGSSPIMKRVRENEISFDEIFVGYQDLDMKEGENLKMLNIYEQITQILLRPSLTKKYG
jgi:predicted GIY-YIG superfamily endonuclease